MRSVIIHKIVVITAAGYVSESAGLQCLLPNAPE